MEPTRKKDDPCAAQGCTSTQVHARGLCQRHYRRMRSTGSLTLPDRPTAEARFLAKVVKVPSGCWLWTAARHRDGYGAFRLPEGALVKAHIWAYEQYVGTIPEGLQLDHLCRVRECVNPAHLEPVTQRENILRGEAPSAQNSKKTHCPAGHPYDKANTHLRRGGGRGCRACWRIYRANSKNRKATA